MAKRRKEGQYNLDSMATAGASSLIGMGMTQFNNKNQLKQQEKLMRQQMEGQKEMSEFNKGLAMQMWEDTNYDAQRQQMEKAGLNVGLMYGMGGGGGTTAASQPSSAPTGGQANPQAMGIEMMMAGQQMKLMEAQEENINADTGKKEVETDKLAGIDTEEGRQRILQSLKGMQLTDAEILKVAKETGKTEEEIRNLIKGREVMQKGIEKTDTEIEQIGELIGKTKEEVKNLIEERKLITAKTTLTGAETKLTEAQTKNVKQATQKIVADIQNGIIQLNQKDIELSQGEWKIKNDAVKTKIEAILKQEGLNIENKRVLNEALKTIVLGAGIISGMPGARPVIGY